MATHRRSGLVSILMESPLYMTLSMEERQSLLTRLLESYPFLSECAEEETEIGYEASWNGVLREN
jgi:hypothetical protein